MQTVTINRGDWTGKETDLAFDTDTGMFEVYGEKYRLAPEAEIDGFVSRDLVAPDGRVICPVNKDGDNWYCGAYGVSREDANPFVAAAQLLFNII